MSIFFKRISRAAIMAALTAALALGANPLSERVDSLSGTVDDIEDRVKSTLMSGGSSPVSFSGEARLRMQYHNLGFDAPGYMQGDRSYFQSGWEGNENLFRLGMIASAGRNTILWSKIGLQHTMVGNYNPTVGSDGFNQYPHRHDKARNSVSIHEDMSAGIAVRTQPASFWVRMGNTMWTEASPLTVWKAQPRTFAWEYLPFEVEQPIARYYEYNIARGEKSGRAAWNKKPFNGINVESINLPANLYANFVYGTFERYDNYEREYIDLASDLGYANVEGILFPEKSQGIGDSYRHVIHGRLAKGKMFGDMTLGLNYVGIDYKDDILFTLKDSANIGDMPNIRTTYMLTGEFRGNDSVFYKEPKTLSFDLKGPIAKNFTIHADVGVNWTDTVWRIDPTADPEATPTERYVADQARRNNPAAYTDKAVSSSDIVPAVYAKLNYNPENGGFMAVEADLAYIGKGFYSPFSFAVPEDAFFAYGSNMVGAGKFIARGEGSPYVQNMAGVNITLTPKIPGYGHFRLKYGQHFNIEEGRDMLYFPYRLNGSDMFSFFHSSYNRWGNGLLDNSVKAGGRTYVGRLGDESYLSRGSYNVNLDEWNGSINTAGPQAGGLRSDFLSMFEGFVAYRSAEEAYNNFRVRNIGFRATSPSVPSDLQTSITNQSFTAFWQWEQDDEGNRVMTADSSGAYSTRTSWVPESKKYTFNLELDAAYDIGPFLGYKKDLFFGGYAGVHGVSSAVKPLAFSDEADDMLLWSFYVRLEPAIALHKNFYLLGLFGYENWRSQQSWMMVDADGKHINPTSRNTYALVTTALNNGSISPDNFVRVPINYHDFAYGLGFDWDMLERVGLHGRVKWMSHKDQGLNDYYDSVNRRRAENGQEPLEFTDADRWKSQSEWSTPVFSLEIKTWF